MSALAIVVSLLVVLAAAAVAWLQLRKRPQTADEKDKDKNKAGAAAAAGDARADGRAEVVGGRVNRRDRLLQQRRRAQEQPRQAQQHNDDDSDEHLFEEQDGSEEDIGLDLSDKKVGKKKAAKLQMKEQKRAEREQMMAQREDAKERERLRDEEDKQKQAEEAAKEKAEADRLAQEEAERKKKEEEEYERLKQFFSVEEEGTVQDEIAQESQSLLQEFVDFLKTRKVVLLEELARHFNLRTQEAINRLKSLEEMGRVTGVMDDRGKYIFITPEEMKNVAKFIRQRGRVSIAEIAENSNKLVCLEGVSEVPAEPVVMAAA